LQKAWETSAFQYENGPFISMKKGVPKGSILSPLLFNIYINDLIKELKLIGKTLAYADDIAIICTDKQVAQVVSVIKKWSRNNDIELNSSKTKIVRINRNCPRKHTINKSTGLEYTKSYKYLGLDIDGKLNFNNILNKCFKDFWHKCWRVRHIRSGNISWYNKILIWISLIRSKHIHILLPLMLCDKLSIIKRYWGRTLSYILGLKNPNYHKLYLSLLLEEPEEIANLKAISLISKLKNENRDIPSILIKKSKFNVEHSKFQRNMKLQTKYLNSINISSNIQIPYLNKILWNHKLTLMYRIGYLFRKTHLCKCGINISPRSHYENCKDLQIDFNVFEQIGIQKVSLNKSQFLEKILLAGEYMACKNPSTTLNSTDHIIEKYLQARSQ